MGKFNLKFLARAIDKWNKERRGQPNGCSIETAPQTAMSRPLFYNDYMSPRDTGRAVARTPLGVASSQIGGNQK